MGKIDQYGSNHVVRTSEMPDSQPAERKRATALSQKITIKTGGIQ
jgi:hypothetical protein